LLENGADISATGNVLLEQAVADGSEAIVRLLLQYGADVNAQGDLYGSAIYAAMIKGNEEMLQLLQENAMIPCKNLPTRKVLKEAAADGSEPLVKLFIENGAEVNAPGSIDGTALSQAAANGRELIVRLLLDNGANINAADEFSKTALQLAAENGNEPIVRLLLDKGANVNTSTGYGGTALQLAAKKGNEPIARLLLAKGADKQSLPRKQKRFVESLRIPISHLAL
jgi:ankyrin repeat protein